MTSPDARLSGCTPFEKELISAMRDFANSTPAPDFAPTAIIRGARRTRALVTAGIAAVLILAGGGTALAVTAGSGPSAGYKPVSGVSPVTGSGPATGYKPVTGTAPATGYKPVTGPSPASSGPATGYKPVNP